MAEDDDEGFIGPIQVEEGEYRGIRFIDPAKARQHLVDVARQEDVEQKQRAHQFQAQVQKAFAKMSREDLSKIRRRHLEPVNIIWLLEYLKRYKFSTALPGRLLPRLLFGDNYEKHPGYIPIERRMLFGPDVHRLCELLIGSYLRGDRDDVSRSRGRS
jgi:hypothetical protein